MIGPSTAPASTEPRLLRHDLRAGRWLVVAVACGLGATLALVGQLLMIALVVAGTVEDARTLGEVWPLLAAGLLLLAVRAALSAISELAARRSARALVGTLRSDLTAQVLHLGPTWTSHERAGEVSGVLIGGLESIEEYVVQYLPARWLATIVPVVVLVLVLWLDPPSVLVLLFTGPLLLLLLAVIGGRTRVVTERRFQEMRTLSAFFLDILRGLATLKMFGRSREQIANLQRIGQRYGDTTMDVLRTAFQTSLVLEWGATIAIALVAVEVGLRLLDGSIAFERALAVLLITPEFFLPLRSLAVRYHVGSAGKAAARRVFDILDEPGTVGRTVTPTSPSHSGPAIGEPPQIAFADVVFSYPGRATPALDSVSLVLRPGESVALVGSSGAGKSTLASLILRFIDPDRGVISVDGKPLSGLERQRWRASVAWVPQRPHLFEGTIADNVRLARAEATSAEVAAAIRAANAAEFVDRLPGGVDSRVGEAGIRLSGGQRQRIAIARAFVRDAPLLILDEATSHQDEASETAVADAVDRLMRGRTVLVIAHRLKLAQRADRVVVLDRGRIVEDGSPADLLATGRRYRRLFDDHGELIDARPRPSP